jgi:hypothetical protein
MPIKLEINPNSLPVGFGGSATDDVTNSYIKKVSFNDIKYTQIPTYIPPKQRVVVDMSGMENPEDTTQEPGEEGGGL